MSCSDCGWRVGSKKLINITLEYLYGTFLRKFLNPEPASLMVLICFFIDVLYSFAVTLLGIEPAGFRLEKNSFYHILLVAKELHKYIISSLFCEHLLVSCKKKFSCMDIYVNRKVHCNARSCKNITFCKRWFYYQIFLLCFFTQYFLSYLFFHLSEHLWFITSKRQYSCVDI